MPGAPVCATADTDAAVTGVVIWFIGFGTGRISAFGNLPRLSRNRSTGNPAAFRVQADRFDHEVKFIGAVDLARHTVGHAGPDEVGFGEVIEPVNPLCIVVLHEEHGVGRVFRPRDQNEMIGAEVKHGSNGRESDVPPVSAAPLWS
jgi:hypothetical protein